ncbi:nitroreductase family deazaflavin-dependent oxidoreductase [Gordonia hydrophobica]|uniref:Nitroreductase family deazaflavin-dependent oxidoreductase n=1 Tax=Gordonia hydrophobica TaxID=40516 RepID=A0ABZ2U1X8_9ACTN|nr:nitroreductase family deazaflavin-dependent oxidoreductase [Gordonia hydrophobica]MBM7366642.1 deazaflavin-dependent oxidoreductase (nitroreductase family) [Gordonia hydrophobica]
MKVPRIVARANKYVTNPIQGLWAGRIAPWAVVQHVGRTSKRPYQTPVLAFVDDGRVSIALNYGAESDWVKNVLEAGEFTLVRGGKQVSVAGVRVLPADSPDVVKSARIPALLADSVLYGRIVEKA